MAYLWGGMLLIGIVYGVLSGKRTYYVRIRSWKKVGKNVYYSGWSKAKKVKIK